MRYFLCALALLPIAGQSAHCQEYQLDTFERQQLTDTYYSEGANAGDLDGDGHPDVVYGPYWFRGPDFKEQHELYAAKPQPRDAYADNFFNWIYDFNGDGRNDVFVVGFPGTPAFVYENPGPEGWAKHWKKHEVFGSVANESPHWVDLVFGDRPELVCTYGGLYGFATADWSDPFSKWTFHAISDKSAPDRFGHGLGVGDVNGDGRLDVLTAEGWFEQPKSEPDSVRWKFHNTPFTNAYGGAEMYAYDVDGDGDNDVITSLAAHHFGLAWYEQYQGPDGPLFRPHVIVGSRPDENRYGIVFSEPHSVALADIDGDGLKDIVTGKTYWSHHRQSPLWDAGAVVYWFRLVRGEGGVDWVPHLADDDAGIGRQVSIVDVNGDSLPDIVLGGMKGCHVLRHVRTPVSPQRWEAAQPKVVDTAERQARVPAPIDEATGKVRDALEGERLKVLRASAGRAVPQEMESFTKDRWSGGKQLFWTAARNGEKLDLELPVSKDGEYEVSAVFTMAGDYGIVQLSLDGQSLGKPIDLFNYPDVITSGVIFFGRQRLSAGKHKLTLEIVGANAASTKTYLVGLDYVSLAPAP
ncbi:MAG TPA: VCBS repeat-containing protein [Pirellulales bacterium]|nr:VCBS repeat-containing protein [Pirellulales bacterium]